MWDKVSDEEIIKEIERRALDNKEKAILVKKGELTADTAVYVAFSPSLPCLIRTGAAEARMLFGMKAEIVSYLLSDLNNEVIFAYMVRLDGGYVVDYKRLDLNLRHPKTGTLLKDAIKGRSIDWTNPTGPAFANEIVDQIREDKSYKLYGSAGYISDVRKGFMIPDDDLDAKCAFQYDTIEINRRGCISPMPPTMRGFLLMGRGDYIDWLREILGGEDLLPLIPSLQQRFKR